MYCHLTSHTHCFDTLTINSTAGTEPNHSFYPIQKIQEIFLLRESVAPSQLVPGLSIEKNQVVVDRNLRTNIPGLFACGDITGAPYQYIKAAGEGNIAALSAVNYLTQQK